MKPIDYSKVNNFSRFQHYVAGRGQFDEGMYRQGDGLYFTRDSGDGKEVEELVNLSNETYLFITERPAPEHDAAHTQIVSDEDRLNIDFRIKGGGNEQVVSGDQYEASEDFCWIGRYPRGSVINRQVYKSDAWKIISLYITPAALRNLLDAPLADFAGQTRWMVQERSRTVHAAAVPLYAQMRVVANDMFSCGLRGIYRRSYMRAKSIELLSMLMQSMDDGLPVRKTLLSLSDTDREKLALARSIIMTDLESKLTLAMLAEQVGLNRTKLALGFKEIYGEPLQTYWRERRLAYARELLRERKVTVTQIAFDLGYSDLSSFTRAFSRKFGVLPKECKGQRA
jgi:AraC-like DNA-binding protein